MIETLAGRAVLTMLSEWGATALLHTEVIIVNVATLPI